MVLDVLDNLRQYLQLEFLAGGLINQQNFAELFDELAGRHVLFPQIPVKTLFDYGVLVDWDVDLQGHKLFLVRESTHPQFRLLEGALPIALVRVLVVTFDQEWHYAGVLWLGRLFVLDGDLLGFAHCRWLNVHTHLNNIYSMHNSWLKAQLRSQLHEQLTQPILPRSITSICPVVIILGVLNKLAVASRKELFLEVLMNCEFGLKASVHYVVFNVVPICQSFRFVFFGKLERLARSLRVNNEGFFRHSNKLL